MFIPVKVDVLGLTPEQRIANLVKDNIGKIKTHEKEKIKWFQECFNKLVFEFIKRKFPDELGKREPKVEFHVKATFLFVYIVAISKDSDEDTSLWTVHEYTISVENHKIETKRTICNNYNSAKEIAIHTAAFYDNNSRRRSDEAQARKPGFPLRP